jgi:hypothetical protein
MLMVTWARTHSSRGMLPRVQKCLDWLASCLLGSRHVAISISRMIDHVRQTLDGSLSFVVVRARRARAVPSPDGSRSVAGSVAPLTQAPRSAVLLQLQARWERA